MKISNEEALAVAVSALTDIIDPRRRIDRLKEPGIQIDGPSLILLSEDPGYLRLIAAEALGNIGDINP